VSELSSVRYRNSILDENMTIIISYSDGYQSFDLRAHKSMSSAGLTIWQKRHMPRAPRFWGPRAYSSIFFRIFLFPVSARGPKEPKSLRKREAPKSKKRGPKKRGSKRFFPLFQRFQCFSVFSVSARGPKFPGIC
jgi:hypothetical protein